MLSRLSRLIKIVETYWIFSTFIKIFWILGFSLTSLSLPLASLTSFHRFLHLNGWKVVISLKIYKKLRVLINLNKSWSQLRLFGPIDVKTKSRNLNRDWDISTAKTKMLKLFRFSRLSRLTFGNCQDQESQLRHDRDKSIPFYIISGVIMVWRNSVAKIAPSK